MHGSKHRIHSGLLHGDFDFDEAGDMNDHAIFVPVLG